MTATNMCSNFGGKWDSPTREVKKGIMIEHVHTHPALLKASNGFSALFMLPSVCARAGANEPHPTFLILTLIIKNIFLIN